MNSDFDAIESLELASEVLKMDGRIFVSGEVDEARRIFLEVIEALSLARQELSGLPHSLGYSFTHLPKIDSALAKVRGEG